ncbi:MAG: bifunctional non-ous end joining protein LigD, partial [Actinomycetota bacterium]|nr:bifunctional non-ous end joining protein LigD [Actinomycetota bacterium]
MISGNHKSVAPMLATLGSLSDVAFLDNDHDTDDEHDADDHWAYEMKWDGIRAIATIRLGELKLTTRNGIDVTSTYPDLAGLGSQVSGDCVLDGEIVALNKAGRPDFGRLQKRMKLTAMADVKPAAREI